ncbi:MAG: hypothetical protein ABWY56_02060 [Propionibacteriaceae bacterium]
MQPAFWFTAAATSYLANCALGAGVATRMISTQNFHWVHHALYICTSSLAGIAASSLLWSRSRAGWLLLPAAVPLAVIPRISARTARHPAVALSMAPFFAASLVRALQDARRAAEGR